MTQPRLVILYVDSPARSARFYEALFGPSAIEESPTFAMIPLSDGMMLGLWSRHTVEPAATEVGGGGEIAFEAERVDEIHAAWVAKGLAILQAPTDLDFGRTFVALDPDGHRLRVFRPAG